MKKISFLSLFILLSGILFAQKQFVYDVDAEMRPISGSFTSIKISGGIDLYLSQSDTEAVAVSASDEKQKASIKTVVENNQLMISFNGDGGWSNRKKKMQVYVSFVTLNSLIASGASDVIVAGKIEVPSFQLQLSGASDFKGSITTGSLQLNLSGASDATINGKADQLTVVSSGASDLKGYDLITDFCTANASGASDLRITVQKELRANASGASKILYKGTATIKETNSSGSSTISQRD